MAEVEEIFRPGIQDPGTAWHAEALVYDERIHKRVLQQISDDTGWEPEEIDVLYKRIMDEYAARAKVHDYLFVLVPKRIRRIIGTRRRC